MGIVHFWHSVAAKTKSWLKAVTQPAEAIWKTRLTGWALLIILMALCGWWYEHTPSPGKSIAAFGVGATIMTFGRKLTGIEKVFWLATLFGFFYVELRSIDEDRTANANAFLQERKRQDAAFEKVQKENQSNFDATLARMNRLTDLAHTSVSKVDHGIALMTGGDSYPYFIIYQGPDTAQLMLAVSGTIALKDLNVNLYRATCLPEDKGPGGTGVFNRSFQIYGIESDALIAQTAFHVPMATGARTLFYGSATALNGRWEFVIRFRRNNHRWAWRFTTFASKAGKVTPILNMHSYDYPAALLSGSGWPRISDDCEGPLDND